VKRSRFSHATDEFGGNSISHSLDLLTKNDAVLPGSAGLNHAMVSPDGRTVVALTSSLENLALHDLITHSTRLLVPLADYPSWSPDGRHIYYSTLMSLAPVPALIALCL
jgi:Tol biopolymer transport system component